MRILAMMKRHYMRHDVIADRYARLFELPRQLAERGHEVDVVCMSYRRRPTVVDAASSTAAGALRWHTVDPSLPVLPPLLAQQRCCDALVAQQRPDVILGTSDVLHVALAARTATRHGLPLALDLYDNYASFGLARVPGLTRAYHDGLRKAEVVFSVSSTLREHVAVHYRPTGATITLESTINAEDFAATDKQASRERLQLPPDRCYVGTAGALNRPHDIETLYGAWRRLRAEGRAVDLLLAGQPGQDTPVPHEAGIRYLGQIPHDDIPAFINALEVAVIGMRDTDFGRFAFPQKAYEILACRTPLVAADVGALRALFADAPRMLYRPGDVDSLANALARQLDAPQLPEIPIPTWAEQAAVLERELEAACARHRDAA